MKFHGETAGKVIPEMAQPTGQKIAQTVAMAATSGNARLGPSQHTQSNAALYLLIGA